MNGTAGDQQQKDDHILTQDPPATTIPAPDHEPNNGTESEALTSRVLRFLSTASPETLGGVAVGLAACTYLILGRVGLVLIGGLGGGILHATWERNSTLGGSAELSRRESSLDIVKRLLDLRDAHSKDDDDDDEDCQDAAPGNSFEGYQPETAAALNELVEAVIRDYVKWWYQPILPKDTSFPAASRQTLTKLILSISQHLSRRRPADTFLDFLTNSSSIVIVFLNELSSAVASSQGTNIPPAEAVYTYLSTNPDSNLANVLNERQQSKKFKMIAEDILQNFLEKATYDCGPARTFLREVLGGLVLEMTLKSCSKPEWINGWIVYLLEEGEPDFSQAIDAGMGSNNPILSNPLYDIDGNVGNIAVAKSPTPQAEKQTQESKRHKKRLSKAEEAMEEAMEEAKRLSRLIAEEDAKRAQPLPTPIEDAPKALVEVLQGNAKVLDLNTTPLTSSLTPQLPLGEAPSLRPLDTTQNDNYDLLKSRELATPTPQSPERKPNQNPMESDMPVSPTTTQNNSSFTSFDQIVPQSVPFALQDGSPRRRRKTVSLTLHNANIILDDDSSGGDKGRLRSKPNTDYLVQIEPASSEHPGWMIVRRYPDFETLHEVLRRIAQISGVTAFAEQHHSLPSWKEHTKASLRGELERYLRDACWYQPLAESEGMKRFLEKDPSQSTSSSAKNGFSGLGWPNPSAFETMGKGMLDVLTNAPKGVAEGGKAIGGGISGVLTNIGSLGQKKSQSGTGNTSPGLYTAGRSSTTLPRMDSMNSIGTSRSGRASEDSLRPTAIIHNQPSKLPSMERRPSYNSIAEDESEREPRLSTSARSSISGRRSTTQSRDPSRASSIKGTPISSPIQANIDDIKLPPPPSDMPDDYGSHAEEFSAITSRAESSVPTTRTSISTAPSQPSPGRSSHSAARTNSIPFSTGSRKPRKEPSPLTEAETRVAVELLFAVITEMYKLSSAWNIRRTLLTAAKTFLLRPGNPSLSSIQSLIQDSVIASNTSDAGIAAHLRTLRANTLPTEDELKAWPADSTPEEKERLRIKARRLLIERGVPTALTGVMGQAATGEAMGKIFDCLQIEEVSRGLMFGLLLQGVRAVTQ